MVWNTALQFHRFDRLDSTNRYAKELAVSGAPHGTVVVAEEQTCGRGRLGREFFSPKGTGIYLSMVLRPEEIGLDSSSIILLTTAASVAVARAVQAILGLELKIKWVNDLYYNEKKVCGILTEGVIDPKQGLLSAIVIGIGVNYKEPLGGFPKDLKNLAGALLSADDSGFNDISTQTLIAAIAEELWAMLPAVADRTFLEDYRQRSMVLGRKVRIFPKDAGDAHPDLSSNGMIVTALHIDADGGLVIQQDDGTIKTLTTGEISLRIV